MNKQELLKQDALFQRISLRAILLMLGSEFRSKNTLRFESHYGGSSYTDKSLIVVGTPEFVLDEHPMYQTMVEKTGIEFTYDEVWMIRTGIRIHETSHLMYSSMNEFRNFQDWAKREFEYLLPTLPEKVRPFLGHIVGKIAAHLYNAIEDGRCENFTSNYYPGSKKYFMFSNSIFWKIKDKKPESNIMSFLDCVNTLAVLGVIPKYYEELDDDVKNTVKNVKRDINEIICIASPPVVTKRIQKLFKKIMPFLEKYIIDEMNQAALMQQIMEMLKDMPDFRNDSPSKKPKDNLTNNANHIRIPMPNDDESDSNESEDGEGSDGGESDDDKKGSKSKSKGKGKGKDKEEADDKSKGSSSDKSDKENQSGDGDKASSKNKSDKSANKNKDKNKTSSDDDSDSTKENNSDNGNVEKTSNKKPSNIRETIEKIKEEIDKKSTEALNGVADEIKESVKQVEKENASVTISKTDANQVIAENNYSEDFHLVEVENQIEPNQSIKLMGHQVKSELRKIFLDKEVYDCDNQYSGKLKLSKLYKLGANDIRIFEKKGNPSKVDTCISICWDGSGSMCGAKQASSTNACAVIEEAVKGFIPLRIINFTTMSAGVTHYNVKDFNQENPRVNYAYSYGTSRSFNGGNKDGYSINIAAKELEKRPEARKFLIVASDGLPSDYRSGQEALDDVKNAVKKARDKGIHVIPIFFGDESFRKQTYQNYLYMYEKNLISCDTKDIAKCLVEELKKIVRTIQ